MKQKKTRQRDIKKSSSALIRASARLLADFAANREYYVSGVPGFQSMLENGFKGFIAYDQAWHIERLETLINTIKATISRHTIELENWTKDPTIASRNAYSITKRQKEIAVYQKDLILVENVLKEFADYQLMDIISAG